MTKRYSFFAVTWILLCIGIFPVQAAEWQWSLPLEEVVSHETNKNPQAFLWIPSSCNQIKAVMLGKHNMSEETLFEHPLFRKEMERLGIALVWITPGIDTNWDVTKGTQQVFENMMKGLAEISGYSELEFAPIVPIGHSAMATYPWNFAAWNPERTLGVISLHGDAPRTNMTGYGGPNIEWGKRTIDGIPGLMIEGEYEWAEDRVTPALAFRLMYPNSCVSFYCDVEHGHFDVSDELVSYITLFLEKAIQYRFPKGNLPLDGTVPLQKLNPRDGWLCARWHPGNDKRISSAPYAKYRGDKHDAFWYFDEEIAHKTERRYAASARKREQYIGFVQQGKLLSFNPRSHARISGRFIPRADGVTFHLQAAYTDTLRRVLSDAHSQTPIRLSRICGPVEQINDSTFRISFYRMGMDSPKRSNDIWLSAEAKGDKWYKGTVQQFNMKIPYRNTKGKRQCILFPGLPDVSSETQSLSLSATSDCGLPVFYYVKEGPAEIKDGKLLFTPIPPRAKYPLKVTVVAWQYGLTDKVQTAEPVERHFYIKK
ncbi:MULTISPECIES: hypothetical protein [Bacteroides]|uniref:hypothetical protein n=1 Tax=Bacteroides TaxID=816 RepID=UPI00319E6642